MKNLKREKISDKKDLVFWVLLIFISFGLFVTYYDGVMNSIDTTMFAFRYKYGFISRGFIGSVFHFINSITPFEMVNYNGVLHFTQFMTVLFFAILYLFYFCCLRQVNKKYSRHMQYIIVFFTIFAIPMFSAICNFGRLDLYMVMLSLLAAILLIKEKAEWLLVPISAIGVMVHQGYVFMFINIILVLLLYKVFMREEKRKKYIILFLSCFCVASVLFLWFELFSHANGKNAYDEVMLVAKQVSADGVTIHQDVIDKEILGIDLADREVEYRKYNRVQFPIFVLLTMPYLIIAFRFFKRLIGGANTKKEKWAYLFVLLGVVTILPDMLLKCDYGRWVFAIICYYAVVILSLLAIGDKGIENQIGITMHKIKEKSALGVLLLVYPIMFQPLRDVSICEFVERYAEMLNTAVLHWW